MPDREEVIGRLEECLSASCRGFRTCPYGDAEWDAVRVALALLREQEQKAEWHLSRPHHFRCSGCGAQWGQAVIGMRYCPTCGRKMTLSAEERRREWPEEVSGDAGND